MYQKQYWNNQFWYKYWNLGSYINIGIDTDIDLDFFWGKIMSVQVQLYLMTSFSNIWDTRYTTHYKPTTDTLQSPIFQVIMVSQIDINGSSYIIRYLQ